VSDPVFADLFGALDIVILERLPDGPLYLFGGAPSWFVQLYGNAASSEPVGLAEAFPFLDGFLSDAARFWWKDSPGRLRSGPCAASGKSGQEYFFEVSAVSVDQRRFLLIERLTGFDETRKVLQVARENALTHERFVSATKALAKPMQAVIKAADALLTSDLTTAQRELVEKIQSTSASVVDALKL
jgi:hypothetical protein